MYRRSTVVVIWSLIIAGAAYLFIFEPGKTGFFPGCPFRFITGFLCPGCGVTRALHHILHGHFETAFMLNPLLLLALPFILFALLRYSVIVMRGGVPRPNALPAPYIYAIFFIILSFWIFRNTPFYPFVA
ncbi:MAG TPA: DUF2752 domain-containing protein [Pyrinomonadaceae bacterium]|nr:DUF2752 domain-containing protein [Pyrinomonadaceae bacterium]